MTHAHDEDENEHARPPTAQTDSVVEAVRADLLRRSQLGIAKYGVTLDRKDLSLRDWLECAMQEKTPVAVLLELGADG